MTGPGNVKIMVAYPPLIEPKGCPMLAQNRQFQWFHHPSYIYPLVSASAATLLSQSGFQVVWADGIAQGWRYKDFLQFLKDQNPQLMALETKTPVIKQHWRMLKEFKKICPQTRYVLMGDHVSARPEETLRESPVDFVITGGDYDICLKAIAEHLTSGKKMPAGIWYRQAGQIVDGGRYSPDYNPDELPFIDRGLTRWILYGERLYNRQPFTYTLAGRDCPWARCTFCSWAGLYPEFKVRSPGKLLDEIGMLIDNFDIREIFDDTGTFPCGEWLEEFCEGMIERGYNKKILFSCNFRFDYLKPDRARLMKKAGFRLMKLGLESANQKTLDLLKKGNRAEQITGGCRIAKEQGLDVHLTIMVGYPWETRQEACQTLNLAYKLMTSGLADMLQSTVVIPYPGTPLYEEAVKNNWFCIDPRDYDNFDMTRPVLKTPDMTPEEVMKLCNRFYRIFFNPGFISHHLRRVRNMQDIRYLCRGIGPVLGHVKDFMRKQPTDKNI